MKIQKQMFGMKMQIMTQMLAGKHFLNDWKKMIFHGKFTRTI